MISNWNLTLISPTRACGLDVNLNLALISQEFLVNYWTAPFRNSLFRYFLYLFAFLAFSIAVNLGTPFVADELHLSLVMLVLLMPMLAKFLGFAALFLELKYIDKAEGRTIALVIALYIVLVLFLSPQILYVIAFPELSDGLRLNCSPVQGSASAFDGIGSCIGSSLMASLAISFANLFVPLWLSRILYNWIT